MLWIAVTSVAGDYGSKERHGIRDSTRCIRNFNNTYEVGNKLHRSYRNKIYQNDSMSHLIIALNLVFLIVCSLIGLVEILSSQQMVCGCILLC